MTSARDYWVKRFDFQGHSVTCVAARDCETSSSFHIGWWFDRKVKGVVTPTVTCRSACERHARLFAFKKGISFPRSVG